jgi:hypothetical protein
MCRFFDFFAVSLAAHRLVFLAGAKKNNRALDDSDLARLYSADVRDRRILEPSPSRAAAFPTQNGESISKILSIQPRNFG